MFLTMLYLMNTKFQTIIFKNTKECHKLSTNISNIWTSTYCTDDFLYLEIDVFVHLVRHFKNISS